MSITVGPSVWFIDNTAPGSLNLGTQAHPFTSIAAFNAAQGTANGPDAGDVIYLREGTYTEADGINLANGQTLIGQGQNLVVNGITIETGSAGQTPTIQISGAGDGVDLASNNTLSGFNITTTGTGAGIDDNGSVGTLSVSDISISTASGTGIELFGGGTVNITGAGNSITTATGQIINWNAVSVGAGGVTFDTLQSTGTVAETAILLSNVDGAGNTFNGGAVTIAGTSGAGSDGIRIDGGSAANFSFGATTVGATGDEGIELNGANGAVTFSSIAVNGSTGQGVEITNATNAVSINGGTIGNSNDPGGIGVDINGGAAAVTIAATIAKTTAGDIVEVTGRTGGTVTLSGNLSATGSVANGIDVNTNTGGTINFTGQTQTLSTGASTAVNLATNTGATINFNAAGGGNGLDITTTSGTGFNATGGGTVNVTGAGNSITTTTGQIVNMDGVSVGASGVTFDTLQSTGTVANTAILLSNVDGAGNTFNGGAVTIAGTSGAASDGIRIDGGSAATFSFAGDDGRRHRRRGHRAQRRERRRHLLKRHRQRLDRPGGRDHRRHQCGQHQRRLDRQHQRPGRHRRRHQRRHRQRHHQRHDQQDDGGRRGRGDGPHRRHGRLQRQHHLDQRRRHRHQRQHRRHGPLRRRHEPVDRRGHRVQCHRQHRHDAGRHRHGVDQQHPDHDHRHRAQRRQHDDRRRGPDVPEHLGRTARPTASCSTTPARAAA